MFNKKLLNVLAHIVAVLLALKALLAVIMFVWAYFGTPPVAMFPPGTDQFLGYMLLLQELGTIVFIYLILAFFQKVTTCDHHAKFAAHAMPKAPAHAVRRVARKTRRKAKK